MEKNGFRLGKLVNGELYKVFTKKNENESISKTKKTKNRTNCFMIFLTSIFCLPTKIVSLQTKIIIL